MSDDRLVAERPVAPEGVALDVVLTEVDISFDSLVGLAFKALIAFLLAAVIIGVVLAFPAFLIYQGTK